MEVGLFLVALYLFGPWCAVNGSRPSDLNVLILSPYPSEPSTYGNVGWPGGPALFPAAELAADIINNRTDILPHNTLRLIDGDSGCEYTTRASVTFAGEVSFNYYNEVIGIVGPACSAAAIEIGAVTTPQYADIVSITISNGPFLRTKNLTNMFRVLSSAKLVANAQVKLLQNNSWTSIATVADTAGHFYLSIYTSFIEIIAKNSINVPPLFDIEDKVSLFNSIRNTFNVIYAFGGSTDSRKLLCLALKLNFVYPDYQWVFIEVSPNSLLLNVNVSYNGKRYTCTEDDMKKAVDRIILLNLRLIPENKTVKTDVGLSYDDFETEYDPYYQKHVVQIQNIDKYEKLLENAKTTWAATYFDSVWALGLALNRTAQVMKDKNMTLSSIKQNGISSIIHNELLSVNFSGLTGQIYFDNETLEVPSIIDIFQMNLNYSVKIGYYYEGELFIPDRENAFFVDPIQSELVTIRVELAAIFFPLAIVIFLIFGTFHLIFLIFHDYKSIRAQSPHFIHLVFSGCYLFIVSSLLDTIRAANWTQFKDIKSSQFAIMIGTLCNVVLWCLTLSTMLIFGTMCALSWRIYRIFKHFLNPGKCISDPFLVTIITVLLTINVTVLVAWSAYDPLLPRFIVTSEGLRSGIVPVYAHCDCENLSLWILLWVLNELLIVSVIILAILNRDIPRKDYFNNTKSHSAMVYTISFLNGICIPTYAILLSINQINASYVVFQLFALGSPVCVCICLLVPPVIPLFIKAKTTLHTKITTMTHVPFNAISITSSIS